ncbi:hypothetical protein ACLB2K_005830 [Fragaria x ananassa]
MRQFDKTHETNAKTELANMIIMHEYPLSMVEHLGFKRYSKALQPSFKVPCRNTIKKEIMKIFEFEKEKTMKLIQMNASRIAITTDMWTANGLDVVRESIETIRSSVAYWTGGPKREEMFVRMARQMEVGCSRKLILDCRTRWNSTYLMLQTTVEYRTVFPALKTRGYKDVPSEQDCNLVVEIAEKLQLFFKATELLSGTKYPTANLLFPKICQIKLAISKWLQSDISEVVEMAKKMEEKFEKYWGVIETVAIATILDPRYKVKLIEFYFKQVYPRRVALEVERVKKPSDNDLGDDDMDAYDAFVSSSSKDTDKSDLERYLDEIVLPRVNDKEFDVLYWWKTSGMKYPTLYKVARDILAILVSTVASESAFSTGGRIVSPHRNRLHSNTLEALMCGRDWLWSELRDAPSTLEDDIDVDEESCHDSDIEFTTHQTDDTNTRRERAARTRSSPLF